MATMATVALALVDGHDRLDFMGSSDLHGEKPSGNMKHGGFHHDLMGFNGIYPLVMTFTVCELGNGRVEIVDLQKWWIFPVRFLYVETRG